MKTFHQAFLSCVRARERRKKDDAEANVLHLRDVSYRIGSGLATIGDGRSVGCVIVFSVKRGRPSLISNHGSWELTHW